MQPKPSTTIPPSLRSSPLPMRVYGTKWCAHTQMVRQCLDRLNVPYLYCDMDEDGKPPARSIGGREATSAIRPCRSAGISWWSPAWTRSGSR